MIYYTLTSTRFLMLIPDLTLQPDLLLLIFDPVQTDVNMILYTNISSDTDYDI